MGEPAVVAPKVVWRSEDHVATPVPVIDPRGTGTIALLKDWRERFKGVTRSGFPQPPQRPTKQAFAVVIERRNSYSCKGKRGQSHERFRSPVPQDERMEATLRVNGAPEAALVQGNRMQDSSNHAADLRTNGSASQIAGLTASNAKRKKRVRIDVDSSGEEGDAGANRAVPNPKRRKRVQMATDGHSNDDEELAGEDLPDAKAGKEVRTKVDDTEGDVSADDVPVPPKESSSNGHTHPSSKTNGRGRKRKAVSLEPEEPPPATKRAALGSKRATAPKNPPANARATKQPTRKSSRKK